MELVALPDKFRWGGRPGLRLIVLSRPAKSAFASGSHEICAVAPVRYHDMTPGSVYKSY
jgi:hypothetical protein